MFKAYTAITGYNGSGGGKSLLIQIDFFVHPDVRYTIYNQVKHFVLLTFIESCRSETGLSCTWPWHK